MKKNHDRTGTARQEDLAPGLNTNSSQSDSDVRTTTNILEVDASSLMYPQSTEKNFDAAYARANTQARKIKTIARAIQHFHAAAAQVPELSDIFVRFPMAHPRLELQKWIRQGETLFATAEQKSRAQWAIIVALQDCWETLRPASPDITPPSSSQSFVLPEEEAEGVEFLAKDSKASLQTAPVPLAVEEYTKWVMRRQKWELQQAQDNQSCCCLIL